MADQEAADHGAPAPASTGAGWVGLRAAARWWPALLATGAAAVSLSDTGGSELGLTVVFFVTAVAYQILAMTTRRWLTWPLILALFGVVAILRTVEVDERWVLGVAAVALAVIGFGLRLHGLRALHIPVALGFVGLSVLAFQIPPVAATVVVAVGLIAHTAWDLIQWRADDVIARSFAQWCAVFDFVVGVGLLATLAL